MPASAPPHAANLFLADLRVTTIVALVLPLLVPCGMIIAVGGNLSRLALPGYMLLVSLMLMSSRRWLYPTFIVGVFAFAPFLRRFADNSGGFVLFNPILIAPYIALLPTIPSLFRRFLGQRPGPVWPFAVFLACTVYGTLIALLNGAALVSSFYEPARWLLPVSLATFIMDASDRVEAIRRNLVSGLFIVLPVLAVYGIYQYITAPPWDTFWMINIDNITFGSPEPFKIRVFSMMNSPFSAAVFATMAMILLAGEGLLGLVIAGIGVPLVALTLVRTAWFGLAVGLLGLFLSAPSSRKVLLLIGSVVGVVLCMALLASPIVSPEVAHALTDRLATFQDLQTDGSANARLGGYDAFYDRLSDYPLGEGFGINQSIITLQNKQANQPLDSGILETYLIFGVVAGSAYFVALGTLVWIAFRNSRRFPARLSGCMAVIASVLAMSFLGSAQIGEVGLLEWATLGIVLSYGSPRAMPIPSLRPREV